MNGCLAIRVSELALCSAVIILVVTAAFPPYWIDYELESSDFSINGATLEYDVVFDVRLGTLYDFEDVDVRISMVDDVRGSVTNISAIQLDRLSRSSDNMVHFRDSIFIPTALLMIRDFCTDDASPVAFRIVSKFSYPLGLMRMELDTLIVAPLSDEGHNLSITVEENSESVYRMSIAGLRETYCIDDMDILVTDGSCSIAVNVENIGGAMLFSASSEHLDSAISELMDSDDASAYLNGQLLDISYDKICSFLLALDYARGLRYGLHERCQRCDGNRPQDCRRGYSDIGARLPDSIRVREPVP